MPEVATKTSLEGNRGMAGGGVAPWKASEAHRKDGVAKTRQLNSAEKVSNSLIPAQSPRWDPLPSSYPHSAALSGQPSVHSTMRPIRPDGTRFSRASLFHSAFWAPKLLERTLHRFAARQV